jgi:hypothetical protein
MENNSNEEIILNINTILNVNSNSPISLISQMKDLILERSKPLAIVNICTNRFKNNEFNEIAISASKNRSFYLLKYSTLNKLRFIDVEEAYDSKKDIAGLGDSIIKNFDSLLKSIWYCNKYTL